MLLSGMNGSSSPERALPLDLRLRAIGHELDAARIDELWIFPPLPNRDVACEFLVLICYDGEDRRRILTAHVDAERSDPESEEYEWVQRLKEHGVVPRGWVPEIPERMLQRLADAGVPEIVEVGGRLEAWEAAIARFANGSGNGVGVHGEQGDSPHSGGVVFERAEATEASRKDGAHIHG